MLSFSSESSGQLAPGYMRLGRPDVRKGFAFPASCRVYLARLRLAMIEA